MCSMESWERAIYLNQFKTEWNDLYDVGVPFVLSGGTTEDMTSDFPLFAPAEK